MRRRMTPLFSGLVAVLGVFVTFGAIGVATPPLHAETVDAGSAALGWQTQNAPFVVLATADPAPEQDGRDAPREISLRVTETLRGTLPAGTVAIVEIPATSHLHRPAAGTTCLAFLASVPAADGAPARFRLVSGAFGLRVVDGAGPESRFPGIVRSIAATLDDRGRVADPAALRPLLVGWVQDADPGIAWSAATDLVRHEELHSALTDSERAAIVAAYRRCPIGKMTKHALAAAVAATRHATAADALVETLLDSGAASVRGTVADALRRLRDPAAESLVTKRIATAPAAARKHLLVALGATGTDAAVPTLRLMLVDDDAAVRAEAARAAGLVARNVREATPEARIEMRADLEHAFTNAKSGTEQRAPLWALAQLDDQDAWAALRRIAADPEQPDAVRHAAGELLRAPRVSLILD